jgi:hypothetical protein
MEILIFSIGRRTNRDAAAKKERHDEKSIICSGASFGAAALKKASLCFLPPHLRPSSALGDLSRATW